MENDPVFEQYKQKGNCLGYPLSFDCKKMKGIV